MSRAKKSAPFFALFLTLAVLLVAFSYIMPYQNHMQTHSNDSPAFYPLDQESMNNAVIEGNYPAGMVTRGYNPISGEPITYNTTSFLATINITSIYAYNLSHLLHENDVTFQLNAILNFDAAGVSYSYWVQDVAELDTSSHGIYFLDNIWNFSSPSITMYDSTVSGNGSVDDFWGLFTGSYLYEDSAPYFAAGNHVNLNYPTTIQLKILSELSNSGFPEVVFQYNDGYGWVTYDNVYFIFSNSIWQDSGFLVSGYSNTGYGLPYDAGVIVGGFGNGAGTNLQVADFTLGLTYWNGHNYQAPQFGYNEGSNTAETVQGASVSLSSSDGVPVAHISTGNMVPDYFYDSNQVGNLMVKINHGTGVFLVSNNSAVNLIGDTIFYDGNFFNLTLVPNSYYLSTEGIVPSANTNVTILNGEESQFSYQLISESDLPAYKEWGITLRESTTPFKSISINTNLSSIAVLLAPANWKFSISSPLFYYPNSQNGTFVVNGNSLNIQFHQVGYLVGSVSPAYANLYLNGELVKIVDGSFNISLSPGSYHLTANFTGYTSFSDNVTVRFNSYTIANVSLAKNSPMPQSWISVELIVGVLGSAGIATFIFWFFKRKKSP